MHFDKFPDISMLEDELPNRSMFQFWLRFGRDAPDQRSGDGRISGRP